LALLLESRTDWVICGQAANGREAVSLTRSLRPDVVVMDLVMPELNGLEATHWIRQGMPEVEVLIYTFRDSEQIAIEALRMGARGYVLKSDPPEILEQGVESLARHTPYVTPSLTSQALIQILEGRPPRSLRRPLLTPREREVVRLVAEGRRTRDIADALGITHKTVESHRSAVMRKLHVGSVAELVRFALENQLVTR
jgi:DNA-binding NarL/FixJ family response regulator